MKKLLSILGAAGLVATSSASVVACGSTPSSTGDTDSIPDISIDYGNSDLHLGTKTAFSAAYDNLVTPDQRTEEEIAEGVPEDAVIFDLTKNPDGSDFNYDIEKTYPEQVADIPMYELIMRRMADFNKTDEASQKIQNDLMARFAHLQVVDYLLYEQIDQNNPDQLMDFLFYNNASIFFFQVEDFIHIQEYDATVRMNITEDFKNDLPEEQNKAGMLGEKYRGKACDGVNIDAGTYYFRLHFTHFNDWQG